MTWMLVIASLALACSPDGAPAGLIFAGLFDPPTINMYDLTTGKELHQFTGHKGDVRYVAVHGDNLFSASGDNTTKQWSIKGQTLVRTFTGHTNGVNTVAVSEDGTMLFTASDDGLAKQWSVATGEVVQTFGETQAGYNGIGGLALTKDSLFTGAYDQKIHQWSLSSGERVKEFSGHKYPVLDVVVDGATLYSASMDNTAKQWEIASGNCTNTYKGHDDTLTSVFYSNGKVFSAGWDSKTTVFDAAKPRVIPEKVFKDGEVDQIFVSGDYLYTASNDPHKQLKVFSIATKKVVQSFAAAGEAQSLAVQLKDCTILV